MNPALPHIRVTLEAILSAAPDGIIIIDDRGIIQAINSAVKQLFGYDEVDLIGRNVRMLMPEPQSREHDSYLRRYLESGEARIIGVGREVRGRRRDGNTLPIRLSVGVAPTEHGTLFVGILQDLSERDRLGGALRQAETERDDLGEQLRQVQKLEAIGEIAGGIAHDFNNILTSVLGSSEILLRRVPEDADSRRPVERIRRAAERGAALTAQLLAFSRRQLVRYEVFGLNEAVRETHELFTHVLREDIEVKLDLEDGCGSVKADRGHVGQIVMNLVINGNDAMPTGGTLYIVTRNVVLDEREARKLDVAPGNYVKLEVTDDGVGMSPEVRESVFKPFFTTKGPGKGTGLGLATVFGLVRRAGGAVSVESVLDYGSTFTVLLPRTDDEPSVETDAPDLAVPPPSSAVVLLVEDDEHLRDLSTEILELEGHEVIACASPAEAIQLVSERRPQFDILITDIVMPGMSGFDLLGKVRRVVPEIKVLFISGYTDAVLAERGALSADDPFLRKPFGFRVFAAKVREVLNGSPAS